MPSAQSCEPVRRTVNSLVLRVLPGHIYLLVNSQGNMQSEEKHQCKLLTHQGSGPWQKSSVGRLAKQWIHTFKHCLCFKPAHAGTRLRDCQLGITESITFRFLARLRLRCRETNTWAQGFHPVSYSSRVQRESSISWEAKGMNILKVSRLVSVHAPATTQHGSILHWAGLVIL